MKINNCKVKTLNLNSQKETGRIVNFIRKTVYSAGFSKVIVPLSGGVDSSVVATLAVKALGRNNVLIARLPYKGLDNDNDAELVIKKLKIPKSNVFNIDIKSMVDQLWQGLNGLHNSKFIIHNSLNKIRLGNIMARVRMIILYDLAKKNQALVCGTENKSEYLLGYYTLYGDSASDLEPIRHLYKTQVRQLAEYLGVPKKIINKPPTAGLWKGQTDEKELGFSYEQADPILNLLFEKRYSEEKIFKMGYKKRLVEKVIFQAKKNKFKREIPLKLKNNLW